MTFAQRTVNLGRLQELKHEQLQLKIQIDTTVKGILVHFEPLDMAMDYIDNIDPMRLKINVRDIDEKYKRLKTVRIEIEKLERELGDNGRS